MKNNLNTNDRTKSSPREKLAEEGAQALSDAELLAIFLGTGTRKRSVLSLAQYLLDQVRRGQGSA